MIRAARFHGVELDPSDFHAQDGDAPSAAALSLWAQNANLWSRAVRIRWRHLLRFQDSGPVVLLLMDGSACLLTGANAEHQVVYLSDPAAPAGTAPIAVDELRHLAGLGRRGGVAARARAAMSPPTRRSICVGSPIWC